MANKERSRSCFVVMPIGAPGDPDHDYFRTLYEEIVRPILEAEGYSVTRADDTKLTGAITRDIVQRLASADLVVADLSGLNPNVFYEIGVRHSLRRNGTILIQDRLRTANIPFDLSAYRAILFEANFAGATELRRELTRFVRALQHAEPDHRDNPVHDWLPTLPANSLTVSTKSEVEELRRSLEKAHDQLREYQQRFGAPPEDADAQQALDVVTTALRQAKEGTLPQDLLRKAAQAAQAADSRAYLELLARLLQEGVHLSADDYIQLSSGALALGLQPVTRAVLEEARRIHPRNDTLRAIYLSSLTHSPDPDDRALARSELMRVVGIKADGRGRLDVPEALGAETLKLLGFMFDAFHADGLDDEVLTITRTLVERFPDRASVLRNHARALERCGEPEAGIELLQRALRTPDADEVGAVWLGNSLHNVGRNVDALEAYAIGCLLDPDESDTFARVATELGWALRAEAVHSDPDRRALPPDFTRDTIARAIAASFSCSDFDQEDFARCLKAVTLAELDPDLLDDLRALRGATTSVRDADPRWMLLDERVSFARDLYEQLKSPLTEPRDPHPPAGLKSGPKRGGTGAKKAERSSAPRSRAGTKPSTAAAK